MAHHFLIPSCNQTWAGKSISYFDDFPFSVEMVMKCWPIRGFPHFCWACHSIPHRSCRWGLLIPSWTPSLYLGRLRERLRKKSKKLATVGNYETLKIMGINHLPSDAGFLQSTVWWGTSTMAMAADKWQSEDGPELRSTPKTNDYLVARDLFAPIFSASSSLQMSSANPHHHLRTNAC